MEHTMPQTQTHIRDILHRDFGHNLPNRDVVFRKFERVSLALPSSRKRYSFGSGLLSNHNEYLIHALLTLGKRASEIAKLYENTDMAKRFSVTGIDRHIVKWFGRFKVEREFSASNKLIDVYVSNTGTYEHGKLNDVQVVRWIARHNKPVSAWIMSNSID